MKKVLIMLLIVRLLFSAVSLGEESISFTDDSGETISLKEKPVRTAILFSSFAEMWTLSGGDIKVTVGESIERGFCKENTIIVDDGAGKRIDLETLIMSSPDFIIGSLDIMAHVEARNSLRKSGVPFALFKVESIEDYLRVFECMANINGNPDAYKAYGEDVYKECGKVIKKARKFAEETPKTILFIRSGSGYSSAKAKTKDMHFAAKMLDELGAINIAHDVPVLIDGLSFEEIYMKDPDIIFISLMGNEKAAREYMTSLLSQEKWQALKAVQTGKCYFLEKDLFQFKPNQRWETAYEEMAKMLYPDWTEDK